MLTLPAEKITLRMVVDAIDDLSEKLDECILGNPTCSDSTACPMHPLWREIKSRQIELLQNVTIADLTRSHLKQEETV